MAVTRPTADDLVGWLKLQTAPSDETLAVYEEAMDATLDFIEDRIDSTLVVAKGFSLVEGDDNYPPRVRTAVLMQASRIAKRSTSPEGAVGFGGDGIVVRIMNLDPDVERFIAKFTRVDGFY